MFRSLVFSCLFLCAGSAFGQHAPKPYGPVPSPAQLKWHEMEMYCLIHYGVDNYTDKEWGYGDEDPALVNPSSFDAAQIVSAAKAGGFRGVIVVAKHHDGLCLWPTKTTTHSIAASPWKNGQGDMMKEYREACNRLGMELGVYCSPWDRNSAVYGRPDYVSLYRRQLTELYDNYGPLFISWHDGANGGDGFYGGANEKRNIDRTTYYGWDTTFAITRSRQPSAVIFGDIGPDVRWVGNEEGYAGETCWATYTPQAPDEGRQPANGYSTYWLGTEGTINGNTWMPAECDVPLRPGWFYHAAQDEQVKSPYALLDLYYKTVGRGADLDLGIAPNREGRLHPNDVRALHDFGALLKNIFSVNLAAGARFTASNVRGGNTKGFGPLFLADNDRYSYWATDDSVLHPTLLIDLAQKQTFNVIRLRENIKLGQRITSFAVDAFMSGAWKQVAAATSIGSNRLLRLPQNITASRLRLRITGAHACVALSDFSLFREPAHLTVPTILRDRNGLIRITTEAPVAAIRYTLDGSTPTRQSALYETPFLFAKGGILKARSFEADNQGSEVAVQPFGLSKKGWVAHSTAVKSGRVEDAIDENPRTVFSTVQDSAGAFMPQAIVVDMDVTHVLSAFTYLPRQDKGTEGIAERYAWYTSSNGTDWQQAAAGEFSNIRANRVEQVVPLTKSIAARYFKLVIEGVTDGNGISVSEIGVQVKDGSSDKK